MRILITLIAAAISVSGCTSDGSGEDECPDGAACAPDASTTIDELVERLNKAGLECDDRQRERPGRYAENAERCFMGKDELTFLVFSDGDALDEWIQNNEVFGRYVAGEDWAVVTVRLELLRQIEAALL